MKKVLVYYSFIITTLIVTLGFLGAKSYPELISAVLFVPLGLYFWLSVLPKRSKAAVIVKAKPVPEKLAKIRPVAEEGKVEEGFDPERRRFLKIIGSTGASIFLLSVFTKKAQAAFFGSVPGPGTVSLKDTSGTQIDPAEKRPTDGYNVTEIDDSSSPIYYGYVNKDGAWFIMKEDSDGAYRYTKGSSGFSTSWTNRASLSYDYFDAVF